MKKPLLITLLTLTAIIELGALHAHVYLVERPRLQVVDLSPRKQEPTQLDKALEEYRTRRADEKERELVKQILDEYRRNREDPFALEDAKIALEKSDISANRKLELRKVLNDLGKYR